MGTRRSILIFMAMLALAVTGCSSNNSATPSAPETTATTSAISNAMSSGVNTLSEAMAPSASGITVAMLQTPSAPKRNGISLFPWVYADTAVSACVLEADFTVACNDTTHEASIIRDWGTNGCEIDNELRISGKSIGEWTNMGDNSCAVTGRPHFWRAVQGQGVGADAVHIHSTDADNPIAPTAAITRTRVEDNAYLTTVGYDSQDFSGYDPTNLQVTDTLTVPGTSRILYKSDGTKLFDHTVSTAVPPSILLTKGTGTQEPTALVQGGTLQVDHNLAKFRVDAAFDTVLFNYNDCPCHPVSGTVNITVTSLTDSSSLGSGTITFTGCEAADVVFQGSPISIPKHHWFEECL